MTELNADFYERLRQDVAEGHTPESGFCFRDALSGAGYDTDLPPWIHIDDIPVVCEELGLNYKTGKRDTVSLGRSEPCIVGHIVQRGKEGEKRIGHWSFFQRAEDILGQISQEDVFAIIELPK
ncbi:hypothetical protein HY087_01295 [Candidatus Gottesmanbacteria bacterium]|nr:hypothetical protein [Candidatus Gottesmanbacteria bacterium]